MNIGLVRHFKVKYDYPFTMKNTTVEREMSNYDRSDLVSKRVDLKGIDWDVCFSSDLLRAVKTAELVYEKEGIIYSRMLREISISDRINNSPLPIVYLFLKERIKWIASIDGHPETKVETKKRASTFLEELLNNYNGRNVLIFTHAFFMLALEKILRNEGFTGNRIIYPRNGILYLFSDGRNFY